MIGKTPTRDAPPLTDQGSCGMNGSPKVGMSIPVNMG